MRSIPTLASNSKLLKGSELQNPEEASASESASEKATPVVLYNLRFLRLCGEGFGV